MNLTPKTEEQKDLLFKTFDRKRWQFLEAYTQATRKALLDSLDKVFKADSVNMMLAEVEFIPTKPLQEVLQRLYTQVGAYYGQQVLDGLTRRKSEDVFQRFMTAYVELQGADLVVNITENTKNQIRLLLERAISSGSTIDEIARAIRDNGRIGGIDRGRVIARTEIIRASNFGSLQGARLTGIPMRKVWLSTRDSRTRIDHSESNEQKVFIDDFFIVGGEQLQYPGDPRGSAGNTINCRCTQFYEPL